METLAPRKAAVTQAATSRPKHFIALLSEDAAVTAPVELSAPLPAHYKFESKSHKNGSLRELNQRALTPIHRPPPALLDKHGNLYFHVKKLLQKIRRQGQNQYLLKWPGTHKNSSCLFVKITRTPLTFSKRCLHGQLMTSDASRQ